jgi:hypothetical protein
MPTFSTSLSAAGWTQSIIAAVAILWQLIALYDPSSFMASYDIPSIPAARLNGEPNPKPLTFTKDLFYICPKK